MNGTDSAGDLSLHIKLIEYATTSFRLLFIQDALVLADFQSNNDLSTLELSAILLNNVLPKIHSYQLTETVKRRLRLLDLHPDFRKTDRGYEYRPQGLSAPFVLTPKRDFSVTEQLPELLAKQKEQFKLKAPIENGASSHTVLVDFSDEGTHAGTPSFHLSLDIASPLSAMLSNDKELSSAQLHSQLELHQRLHRAKQSFENNGRMQPYRSDLESLINYIESFEKLKTSLCKALSTL